MKETWDRKMRESFESCARAEEMVAYLYGEASQTEARDFERHLQRCASCRTETAAFSDVREAISEWRQQALGTLSASAFESHDVTAFASPRETSRQRRSAFAALREFFTLSPVWMRAATAVVALVFCALVVIAIAHFREQSKAVVAVNSNTTNVTQKENQPEVAVKDTPSNETPVSPTEQQNTPPPETTVAANQTPAPKIRHHNIGSQQFAKKQRQQFLPRSSDNPSAELAADYLPFTAPQREERLPSLIDLVDEPN